VDKTTKPNLLANHFFKNRGSRDTSQPKSPSELELERNAHKARLSYSNSMTGTFASHLNDLDKMLHEEALKIGVHKQGEVQPNAPSRCGAPGGEIQLTELQRAAQRFFEPGCPPPMRRIMVELSPGMGKTCIYMEVISKFIGKRDPDTGKFFDIIILGDDEVFSALNTLRNCPARADIEAIVHWNVEHVRGDKEREQVLARNVLYKRNAPLQEMPQSIVRDKSYINIKDVNKSLAPKCALNTELNPPEARASGPSPKGKAKSRAKAAPSSSSDKDGSKPKPWERLNMSQEELQTDMEAHKAPMTDDKKERPLEEKKSAASCGDDALVWRGSRVFMIPYEIAAKWVVYTGKGVPLKASENGPLLGSHSDTAFVEYPKADVGKAPFSFKDKRTEEHFHKEFGELFSAKELGTSHGGLMNALQTKGNSPTYQPGNLILDNSALLVIVDEVQNLGTPSKWGKEGHHAKPFSPALSEALWRCTGDFCDEEFDADCAEGIRKTPYIFAGTATPNTGTNPESTICLLQILNGRQRAHLFVPRWKDSIEASTLPYDKLKPRTLKEYRDLLHNPVNRTGTMLHWPPFAERKAKNLVVLPRSFLEESSGFVKDVTKGGKDSGAFPLLVPKRASGTDRVYSWGFDKQKYTYAEAAKKVLTENLLPEASDDVSSLGAYKEDAVKRSPGKDKSVVHDLAYKTFICAARDEDLKFQYTRIYKPVYEDELNRFFLQDMVASRVFTANSYFDYRMYPQVDPVNMMSNATPLTRLVVPKKSIRCLPLKVVKGKLNDDRLPKSATTSRMQAEWHYPFALVKVNGEKELQKQYPWQVPTDSAETFVKNLRTKPDPDGRLKDCRWGEWSLCADLQEMKTLCHKLYVFYSEHEHAVDLELENRLRDFVARNCPKLVVAADDMYAYPPPEGSKPDLNVYAPGLAAESKSFFFMNATNRKDLNSNYFVILASFYFRMRCRPYLQSLFKGHEEMLPPAYRNKKATVQHRIAWLDALLLRGGDYSWLQTRRAVEKIHVRHWKAGGDAPNLDDTRKWADPETGAKLGFPDWGDGKYSYAETLYPPYNSGDPKDKTPPDSSEWYAFWTTWLKGYGMQRSAIKLKRLQALQLSLARKKPPPSVAEGGLSVKEAAKKSERDEDSRRLSKIPEDEDSEDEDSEDEDSEDEDSEDEDSEGKAGEAKRGMKAKTLHSSPAATIILTQLRARAEKIKEAKKALKEQDLDLTPQSRAELNKVAEGKSFLATHRKGVVQKKTEQVSRLEESFYMPAIYSVGDSAMTTAKEQTLHKKLYCTITKKILEDTTLSSKAFRSTRPSKEWDRFSEYAAKVQECEKSGALSIEDVVELMGSSGLREALVKSGMGFDPCVKSSHFGASSTSWRQSSAGQSMIFAGLAAHKALDFKCTGLNVAFGPQPRGQRIQEMGRNWRTCVNLPFVAIRQLFLDGEEEILKNDLLLDSFYLAQNEVLDWMRIITISAGLGCSLWWGYSNWAKLLSSYRDLRHDETEWFFGKQSPCMDSKFSQGGSKPSLLDWYGKDQREKKDADSFWRCNRTSLDRMFLGDKFDATGDPKKPRDSGRIIRSVAGAFSPDEITLDEATKHADLVIDPSCTLGSAVEVRSLRGASVKYCIKLSETPKEERLTTPRLKMAHFTHPTREHPQTSSPRSTAFAAGSHATAVQLLGRQSTSVHHPDSRSATNLLARASVHAGDQPSADHATAMQLLGRQSTSVHHPDSRSATNLLARASVHAGDRPSADHATAMQLLGRQSTSVHHPDSRSATNLLARASVHAGDQPSATHRPRHASSAHPRDQEAATDLLRPASSHHGAARTSATPTSVSADVSGNLDPAAILEKTRQLHKHIQTLLPNK